MINKWGQQIDESYDYYADDAEAVVYMIMEKGNFRQNLLFVMRRVDAVKFCSNPKTSGGWGGRGKWAYAFTTYRRDWRDTPEDFRRDDGRFDALLDELGIVPIFRGGQPMSLVEYPLSSVSPVSVIPIMSRQLSLFGMSEVE